MNCMWAPRGEEPGFGPLSADNAGLTPLGERSDAGHACPARGNWVRAESAFAHGLQHEKPLPPRGHSGKLQSRGPLQSHGEPRLLPVGQTYWAPPLGLKVFPQWGGSPASEHKMLEGNADAGFPDGSRSSPRERKHQDHGGHVNHPWSDG